MFRLAGDCVTPPERALLDEPSEPSYPAVSLATIKVERQRPTRKQRSGAHAHVIAPLYCPLLLSTSTRVHESSMNGSIPPRASDERV